VNPAKIDHRTAADVEQQTKELLVWYLRQAGVENQLNVESTGALAGLITIFSRFAEILIERLNQAPGKNLLAFLDRLGISRLQSQEARVPLTFQTAPGRLEPAIVATRTQVAAAPSKGDTHPIVFETERELVVAPVKLAVARLIDPANDENHAWTRIFADVLANRTRGQLEHTVYLDLDDMLTMPRITQIRLAVDLAKTGKPDRQVTWEMSAASGWTALKPDSDTTRGFSQSGEVIFRGQTVAIETKVHNFKGRWLRCRLVTRLIPDSQSSEITSLNAKVTAAAAGLPIDRAFSDSGPIDITRDFFPFGPRPRFGSVFYFGNAEAFSLAESQVDIDVELTNPTSGGPEPPIPRTNAAGTTRLAWEFWDGLHWIVFGVSGPAEGASKDHPGFEDGTRALTQSGHIRFQLPIAASVVRVNGIDAPWIRVRLVAGNYGNALAYMQAKETEKWPKLEDQAQTQQPPPSSGGLVLSEPTVLAPPSIHSMSIAYTVTRMGNPARVLAFNSFTWSSYTAGEAFQPFQAASDPLPALYIGLEPLVWDRPSPFGDRSLSFYFVASGCADIGRNSTAPVAWEYWNGTDWQKWTVRDETSALARSGPVRILPPDDFAPMQNCEPRAYWIRAFVPLREAAGLKSILLNAVPASQAVTHNCELLGASDGSASQVFRTLHMPILNAPSVEVREPQEPPPAERTQLEQEEGEDILVPAAKSAGKADGVWVRWHEVPDFQASGTRDRHYVINHFTGEVRFGDARRGMIPPAGLSNVRASYRTGGGFSGNCDPLSITQLKTTVPYIERALNYEPSAGGVDPEDEADLSARGTATLRHGGRAVARQDYEDLAVLASPEVARAKCVPLRDLADPQDPNGRLERRGFVSVIVVPNSDDSKPLPTRELLDRVRNYLDERRPPTAQLSVVPPDYIRVDINVEVVLESFDAGDVELAIIKALNSYLHPLIGGPEGTGWKFGRRVSTNDIYRILRPIPGIGYVSRLGLQEHEDRSGAGETNRFLIYSGTHTVRMLPPEN